MPDPRRYYEAERERYGRMLGRMKGRWLLYISGLEAEIIEEKLEDVLASLTFKYTRQPELLSLIPDRITEANLRVASTVKLHSGSAAQPQDEFSSRTSGQQEQPESGEQFYRDVYGDPERSQGLRDTVGSVLHAASQPEAREASRPGQPGQQSRGGTKQVGTSATGLQHTVTKHVCVAGVEPAKRPKYQLIASVLYLLDFRLRKVNRRTELLAQSHAEGGQEAE